MHWCQQSMELIGHPEPPHADEFFNNGLETVPRWYEDLIFYARANAPPEVGLLPREFVDFRQELVNEIFMNWGRRPERI
jgi:hypothetical protein